jgi:hypothetical protein
MCRASMPRHARCCAFELTSGCAAVPPVQGHPGLHPTREHAGIIVYSWVPTRSWFYSKQSDEKFCDSRKSISGVRSSGTAVLLECLEILLRCWFWEGRQKEALAYPGRYGRNIVGANWHEGMIGNQIWVSVGEYQIWMLHFTDSDQSWRIKGSICFLFSHMVVGENNSTLYTARMRAHSRKRYGIHGGCVWNAGIQWKKPAKEF